MSDQPHQFAIGDRVRVSESYWVAELRGLIGRLADHGDLTLLPPDALWVEFDRPAVNHGDVEAGAFLPDDLIRI